MDNCAGQVLRHIYVLAVEDRSLSAIDHSSGANVHVRLLIKQLVPKEMPSAPADLHPGRDNDGDEMMVDAEDEMEHYVVLEHELCTPCLLPEQHLVTLTPLAY